jgi:hypothetical protein
VPNYKLLYLSTRYLLNCCLKSIEITWRTLKAKQNPSQYFSTYYWGPQNNNQDQWRAAKYRAQYSIILVLSTVHNIIRYRHNWALSLPAKWFAFWIFDSHFTSHVKLLFLICFHLFFFSLFPSLFVSTCHRWKIE